MIFLFDLAGSQPNDGDDFSGGGKYTKKIFFHLVQQNLPDGWEICCLFDGSRDLDKEIESEIKKRNIKLIDLKEAPIEEIITKYDIKKFFSGLPTAAMGAAKLSCDFYSTIHGLRFLETNTTLEALKYNTSNKDRLKTLGKIALNNSFKKKFYSYYGNLLKNSKVITVSDHTKYSIRSYFPGIINDLPVFYSPDVTEFSDSTVDSEAVAFKRSGYFLLVSGNRWIKNNLRSIIALDSVFSENKDITNNVIITGVKNPEVFLKHIVNKDRFVFYKYVSESLLEVLYKNAFAFIYMSLNEGFGYPPLEAMKNSVPTITSPFTSIPEICGDAVLYSDPYSIPEIKNRILQLTDPDIYRRLSTKAATQYRSIKDRQEKDLDKMIDYLFQ